MGALCTDEIEGQANNQRGGGKLQQEMKQLGCLLIAVTDNLGYVSFEYCVDGTENSDGSTTLTVTEADADALAGQSVKAMSQTPAGLQKLVELIK